MIGSLLLSVLATPCAVVAAPPTALPAAVQDDPVEKPDKRPEVAALLDQLRDHAKARGAEDQQAIQVIDQLLQEFPNSGEKDRDAIAKALSDCLKQKRQEVEGRMQNEMYIACAVALGKMGPESVKPLTEWIDHKTHRKDLALQAELIRSLGKTKDEKAIKTLVGLLTHKDASNQAAAAEALGEYDGMTSDVRKEIFEEVLKAVNTAKDRMDSNIEDLEARDRYNAIKAPMVTTLQKLSGHDTNNPDEWRSWWNDNKKKDWDKAL